MPYQAIIKKTMTHKVPHVLCWFSIQCLISTQIFYYFFLCLRASFETCLLTLMSCFYMGFKNYLISTHIWSFCVCVLF